MQATAIAPDDATDLIVKTVRDHADSMLRVARKYSICADDAQDAYQRAMEIFMRRAGTLNPDTTAAWLRTVVKHEALAVREARLLMLGPDDTEVETREAVHDPSPEERALSFDMVARSAEALQRLKPQELRALWLKAAGHSYAQIAESEGWTYTKVNRCIAEGRARFLARYASIESGAECDRWAIVVSAIIDGEATRAQIRDARPHLRNCTACRAVMREADAQRASFAALFPVTTAGAAEVTAGSEVDGLLSRLYEVVTSALHERAAASLVKFQAVLDVASTGKVAAVAASAAAVAGGGAAVVDRAADERRSRERQVLVRRAPAAADVAVRIAAVRKAPKPASGAPKRLRPTSRRSVSREFGAPRRARGGPSREFGAAAAATARPVQFEAKAAAVSATRPAVSTPSQVDAEFGP